MAQLAFVVSRDGSSSLQKIPVPLLTDADALVRVLIAGICKTDLEVLKGYAGFDGILGHEFVGIVERSSKNRQDLVGKRVVGEINIVCGSCASCKRGGSLARNHCLERQVLGIRNRDGTYSENLVIPAENLHVVPDNVTTENAAFAEPLAAAFRVVEQNIIKPRERVAVVGDGKLGLLLAEVLGRHLKNIESPSLVLIGRHLRKMALISAAASVETMHSSDAIKKKISLFDIVVDATGTVAGLKYAAEICRPEGKIILKSTCAEKAPFNNAQFVVNELCIIGSRCGPFEPALQLLADGLDLTPMIDREFHLEQVQDALVAAREPGALKVLLRCGIERERGF